MSETTEEQRKSSVESCLSSYLSTDPKLEDAVEVEKQSVTCEGNSKITPEVELKDDAKPDQTNKHEETCGPGAEVEW